MPFKRPFATPFINWTVMKEHKQVSSLFYCNCNHKAFEIYPVHHISDSVSYTSRYPLGVVGIITSWASPLHSILWHAILALTSGNCVVIKPSCLAPIEVHLLAKTFTDAGNQEKIIFSWGNTKDSTRMHLIRHEWQPNSSQSSLYPKSLSSLLPDKE